MDTRMFKAYDAARRMVAEEMAPVDAQALRDISEHDVVVVRGQYDRVEDVLGIVDIRHRLIEPAEVDHLRLVPEQLLILNCPGTLSRKGITTVRKFVEEGGSLFA